ncbi:hypothetical protein BDB00DRAFT_848245 [Zychaea mexicana]|uniref:uncharacterized protein n=1 Tax=Zychaea mexicana TaxID=64656 RepID=UPI0022FE4A7A|nr:uncharacterized protein BDB00DRAFT_848245 [Zychaea mexicana]KAI9488392.1 hypothetical protein BDB00DRAFT_848245 [Zychaea mexicana]
MRLSGIPFLRCIGDIPFPFYSLVYRHALGVYMNVAEIRRCRDPLAYFKCIIITLLRRRTMKIHLEILYNIVQLQAYQAKKPSSNK